MDKLKEYIRLIATAVKAYTDKLFGAATDAIEETDAAKADKGHTHKAAEVAFTDGKTFQNKLDDGTLKGAAATVTVGTVTTGAPSSKAAVVNKGTGTAAVLDFTIPQGVQGIQGPPGTSGASGSKSGNVIDRVFVSKLPTEGFQYDFGSGGNPVTDTGHCSGMSVADGYLTVRSDERAAEIRKGRAVWRFLTDGVKEAGAGATVTVEFDTRVPADTRWHIALVNLDKRGGTGDFDPDADNYDTTGVAFWHGVINSTQQYLVDGRNGGHNREGKAIGNLCDVWLHTEATYTLGTNWIYWALTKRDTAEVIDTYSGEYLNYSGDINGIELHTWAQTSVDVDNLSVKAVSGIDRYRIFTKGGKNYLYNGNTPHEI